MGWVGGLFGCGVCCWGLEIVVLFQRTDVSSSKPKRENRNWVGIGLYFYFMVRISKTWFLIVFMLETSYFCMNSWEKNVRNSI